MDRIKKLKFEMDWMRIICKVDLLPPFYGLRAGHKSEHETGLDRNRYEANFIKCRAEVCGVWFFRLLLYSWV